MQQPNGNSIKTITASRQQYIHTTLQPEITGPDKSTLEQYSNQHPLCRLIFHAQIHRHTSYVYVHALCIIIYSFITVPLLPTSAHLSSYTPS